jgi:N-hydroxyarylamine O-acetyltransferase
LVTSAVTALPEQTVLAYLGRLGLTHADVGAPGPPTLDGLRILHAAHCARVPYENIDIVRGCPPGIDPRATAERFIAGRGGYCYLLNGGFSALLASLGYQVTRHVGAVWRPGNPGAGSAQEAWGRHLALTVELEGRPWFVDVGLGDALYEPVALPEHRDETVVFAQGPFEYRLEASEQVPGAWRFVHDPSQASFTAMDFGPDTVPMVAFRERHKYLSNSPNSGFVRVLKVMRREPQTAHVLTGCILLRQDSNGRYEHTLTSPGEWFDAVADVFGMPLADVDPAARVRLWEWLRTSHDAWVATQQGT